YEPTPPGSEDVICQDDDGVDPYESTTAGAVPDEAGLAALGIDYNPGGGDTDTYSVDYAIGGEYWHFLKAKAGTQDGSVTLTGTTSLSAGGFVESEGSITLDNAGVTISDGVLKAAGDITINPETTAAIGPIDNSNTILYASGTIDIANAQTVNGNIAAAGNIVLKGGTFNGTIVSEGTITLQDNACTIAPPDNIALIAYNDSATPTAVNLSSSQAHNITGLIYVGTDDTAAGNFTITTNAEVNGTVVVEDTVNLDGGTLTWDRRNYTDTSSVFQNFSGGRRVYLPVIGSWKEVK
ncbi:MAG: hypothetical protein KAX20_06010, partial [Candidatus Omnitrophica bacterium]|nr:hypothetical protein [Candidatus Omnitrophota bacterium]